MKYLILLSLVSTGLFAQTYDLGNSSATYIVKAFGKSVDGTSKELKGKMNCSETECEFLVAAPVKSFVSSDDNRDDNMERTTESAKIPLAIGKGKFKKEDLSNANWTLPLEVDFHGVKKFYNAQVKKEGENHFKANFVLKLEDHKIERPSLFTVKVQDAVPMSFDLNWLKK